ncbi:MAG: alpha/beta fold hydrolase [Arenicella sp.]
MGNNSEEKKSDIAIIGLACRFPGANNASEFWENLKAGKESIHTFSHEELLQAGVDPETLKDPNYVFASPTINDVDQFDAGFFDYSPREARIMDPQHRLLLQTTWQAFEDAGYNCQQIDAPVAVFAGSGGVVTSYLADQLQNSSDLLGTTGSLEHLGNDKDFIATRLSYKLNLTGPSITVQTACSTSMVAVHLACQSLLSGESDMALAGAATVRCPHQVGYLAREGDILSSDGHCRAFDEQADGTVFGSGIGAVLLKPLDQALADKDPVYAVIKSTAINNDGNQKVSYTASSVDGQARAMVEALALSEVEPQSIDYVECHGTGTIVGDPLEINALSQAFRLLGDTDKAHCAIGSVKTNIGHLEQTAGMASLIKTALMIKHAAIPESLNFSQPNPKINFADSPFFVSQQLQNWPETQHPRRAGINSLGLGGTNAFVILEQAPDTVHNSKEKTDLLQRPQHLAVLSARDENTLQRMANRLSNFCQQDQNQTNTSLAEICHTLTHGRASFEWRSAKTVANFDDLQRWLHSIESGKSYQQLNRGSKPNIAFLFTGQGAQYAGMAHELYQTQALVRRHIDRCSELAMQWLGCDLRDIIFQDDQTALNQTEFTQPALFVIETALDQLWRSWGIQPSCVVGHSVGEYAAAVSSAVMSLDDGLKLICERARLMQLLPEDGTMAAIFTDETTVELLLTKFDEDKLSIAGLNSQQSTVISGSKTAVDKLLVECAEQSIETRLLTVSHAFHSALMDPILSTFEDFAQSIDFKQPEIPLISNLTGTMLETAPNARYWCDHARQAVRFRDALSHLHEQGITHFLEIGPGKTLINFARAESSALPTAYLPSLIQGDSDWSVLLKSLSQLSMAGAAIDWQSFDQPYSLRRLSIPSYPFSGKRYWFKSTPRQPRKTINSPLNHPLINGSLQEHSNGMEIEVQYSLSNLDYLRDHVIYDLLVLPFMATLEAAVAAGHRFFGERVALQDILYRDAILLESEQALALQISLSSSQDKDKVEFDFSGLDDSSGFERQHVFGSMKPLGDRTITMDTTPATDEYQEISTEKFYTLIKNVGLVYGPRFKNIQQLWQSSNQAMAHIILDSKLVTRDYALHPALLDACLHIFPALIPEYGNFDSQAQVTGDGFLPLGLENFSVYRTSVNTVWARATRREYSDNQLVIDIDIFERSDDQIGIPVARLQGLSLKRLPRKALLPTRYLPDLYTMQWSRLSIPATNDIIIEPEQHWLILTDSDGVGNALAEQLQAHNTHVTLVQSAKEMNFPKDSTWSSNPDIAEHYPAMLEAYHSHYGHAPDKVIALWPSHTSENNTSIATSSVAKQANSVVENVFLLAQALVSNETTQTATQLHLVTRNTVSIEPGNDQIDPTSCGIWGFGRTLSQEHPALWGGLIDLPNHQEQDTSEELAKQLLSTILSNDNEDQVALRKTHRFGARLVKIEDEAKSLPSFKVTEQGCYLITGGLGALGLKVANWLVTDCHARQLVLVGRSAPSESAQDIIDSLEGKGAEIAVMSADITHSDSIDQLLTDMENQGLNLRGIVHAAGGLDDGVISSMTLEQFRRITGPKITGSWLLHEKTQHMELDDFILFSSVLSLTGSAGQCNYTSANAFMDGLTSHRKALGLAATVINWGPWADAGLATHSGERGELIWQRRGTDYLPPERAMASMTSILQHGFTQAAVTITDWSIYTRQFSVLPAIYQELVSNHNSSNDAYELALFKQQLSTASIQEQVALLNSFISDQVQQVLGLEEDELSLDTPFQDVGLDSLMTVELLNRLNAALPVKVSMAKLIKGASVTSLMEEVFPDLSHGTEITSGKNTSLSSKAQSAPENESQWLVYSKRRPSASIKLVCFAYAGGGPTVYREWQDQLPDFIEVVSVLLPGRASRIDEQPLTRISQIVADLLPELLEHLDGSPFAMFGHCMGSIIMYETARALQQQHNLSALQLFASGAPAPDLYTISFYHQSDEADLMALLNQIDFSATQALVQDAEMRALVFPMLRADLEAAAYYAEEYQASEPLNIPITAFGGWQDMYASPQGVDAWQRFTDNDYQLVMQPGNHYFIETEQARILNILQETLKQRLHPTDNSVTHKASLNADKLFLTTEIAAEQRANDTALEFLSTKPEVFATISPVSLFASREQIKMRLICFSPAWTGGLNYRSWLEQLPSSIEIVQLHYPWHGINSEHEPLRTVAEMTAYAEQQLSAYIDQPFAFFGHGIGGLIAYELTQRYQSCGQSLPVHLFVSAVPSPDTFSYPWSHLQPDNKLIDLLHTIGWPEEKVLIDKTKENHKNWNTAWMAVIRADFSVYASYRYTRVDPLNVPITLFTYEDDLWVSPLLTDKWRTFTSSNFKSFMRQGDHFSIMQNHQFETTVVLEELLPSLSAQNVFYPRKPAIDGVGYSLEDGKR